MDILDIFGHFYLNHLSPLWGYFSRQGKHREFCFGTGKNFETQGKCFSVTQGKYLIVIIKIKRMFTF